MAYRGNGRCADILFNKMFIHTSSTMKLAICLEFVRAPGLVLLMVSAATFAIAGEKTPSAKQNPEDLIGLETNGPVYPNGWKQIGSDGF